uniref:Uncharacterized protein n=1 Tax=Arundo donax TaxID=35708 RepID=A0A0A9ETI5_ARUDO
MFSTPLHKSRKQKLSCMYDTSLASWRRWKGHLVTRQTWNEPVLWLLTRTG